LDKSGLYALTRQSGHLLILLDPKVAGAAQKIQENRPRALIHKAPAAINTIAKDIF
jgi:hypothetical protein